MSTLPATTWDRHAVILRDLALTGPAEHRHVYASAAREAEAHAETARIAEAPAPSIMVRLDRAANVAEIADLMLEPSVQQTLASLSAASRDAVRDHAAERTRALGWTARTRHNTRGIAQAA